MARYDQCDQTCTTDCGHCKGQGPPTADKHGNVLAREGVDRCHCGSKYWENDRCHSCGEEFRPGRCPGCGQTFRGARGLKAHQSKRFIALACKEF